LQPGREQAKHGTLHIGEPRGRIYGGFGTTRKSPHESVVHGARAGVLNILETTNTASALSHFRQKATMPALTDVL